MPIYTLVPLAAVIRGYQSISGICENGSLKLHLTLPYTRSGFFTGVILGRCILNLLAVTIGFIAAAIVYTVQKAVPSITLIGIMIATMLLVVTMSVLVVSISAVCRTNNKSMAINVLLFLGFLLGWNSIPVILHRVLKTVGLSTKSQPIWAAVFDYVNPLLAFRNVSHAFADVGLGASSESAAFYNSGWFGCLVFACWTTAALLYGSHKFQNIEI